MNKIIKLLGVAAIGLTIVACSDDDDDAVPVVGNGACVWDLGAASQGAFEGGYCYSGFNDGECDSNMKWASSCPSGSVACGTPNLYVFGTDFDATDCPDLDEE